jgi:hypothetical protein
LSIFWLTQVSPQLSGKELGGDVGVDVGVDGGYGEARKVQVCKSGGRREAVEGKVGASKSLQAMAVATWV